MSGWGTGWLSNNDEQKEPALETLAINNVPLNQAGETAADIWKSQQKAKEEILNITGLNRLPNKKPTHNPYTNPNAHIYYECGCGAILDPGTKSFAALNNCASNAGWKVRWGAKAYQPYCPKCGEGVE